MNELLAWSLLLAAALLAVSGGWWRRRVLSLQRRREAEGWRLINELKAYGAWLELLRGEYGLNAESAEAAQAAALALRSGAAIIALEFPELAQASTRLAQTDGRLATLLVQRKVRRAGAPAAVMPPCADPACRELLDSQLDLVEELIARCQVLIGVRDAVWHGTDLDSEFAPSFSLSTTPVR